MNSLLSIPPQRMLVYIAFLALVPIALALFSHQKTAATYHRTGGEIASLYEQALLQQTRESGNQAIRKQFSGSDHYYIDNHVETLKPLQDEVTSLQALLSSDEAGVDESLVKRLMFLKEQNRILFAESQSVQYGPFQETTETLQQPVEVNEFDIVQIIDKIENPLSEHKPPQLFITKFRLERKNRNHSKNQDQTFHLSLQMVKREF